MDVYTIRSIVLPPPGADIILFPLSNVAVPGQLAGLPTGAKKYQTYTLSEQFNGTCERWEPIWILNQDLSCHSEGFKH